VAWLVAAGCAAADEHRNVLGRRDLGVSGVGEAQHHGMIKQGAIAFPYCLHCMQEVGIALEGLCRELVRNDLVAQLRMERSAVQCCTQHGVRSADSLRICRARFEASVASNLGVERGLEFHDHDRFT
jgi:hypothetical protein